MVLRLESRPTSCSTGITIIAAALMGLGIIMVFSASVSLIAPPITEEPLRQSSVRQAIFTIFALLILLVVGLCPFGFWRIRPRSLFQPSVFLLLITLALLALTFVPGIGVVRHGARRWISIGPSAMGLGFQPSEIAKLSLVVFLAAFCAFRGEKIRRFWTGFLPPVIILGAIVALVGKEDFGTAALLLVVGGALLFSARAKIWHLVLVSLPALAGLAYLVASRSYRRERLLTFLDPYADPQGAGYHSIQSLVTIASGGWWGRGLGAGIQKYGYLPEGRTDFIFAVICEELGIIGGITIIALFAVLLWQGRKAMLRAPTAFGRHIALGATLTIGIQAAMNIAVVTVSVPTKGISLPFVSAGGSGVVFFSILVGLLVSVARDRDPPTIGTWQQLAEPTNCSGRPPCRP